MALIRKDGTVTQERIRHTKEKDEERFLCKFPDCTKTFVKEPGKPDACPAHRQLIADVVYILNHLGGKPGPEPEESKGPLLFIPKPGMSNKAIREAIEQRGKIK